MALVEYEPGLQRIAAVESEVEALYRSARTVTRRLADGSSLDLRAYVFLLVTEDGDARVRIALHAKDIDRSLVFAVRPEAEPGLLDQGLAFAEGLGFEMEEVNLKFGTAMREVLLKEIPVLCSPDQIERACEEEKDRLAEWKRIVEVQAQTGPLDEEGLDEEERKEKQRQRKEDARQAKAAARKLKQEEEAEARVGLLAREVQELLADDEPSEQRSDQPLRAALAETERQREGLEKTRRRLEKQLELARSDHKRKVAALEDKIEKADDERKRAQKEKESLEQRLQAAEQEVEGLQAEGEKRQAEGEKSERARAKMETRLNELEKELVAAWQELEEGKKERERLNEDKDAAEERIVQMEKSLGEAEAALTRSERTEAAAKKESEEAQERLRRIRGELDAAREEMAPLRSERDAAQARLDELQGELDQSRRQAAEKGDEAKRQDDEATAAAERLATVEKELQKKEDEAIASRRQQRELKEANEALERRLKELRQGLDAARRLEPGEETVAAEDGERIVALEEALQAAREEADAERFEKELLAREKAALEKRLAGAEELPRADHPAAEGADDLRETLRRAEEQTEFLRLELEKMTAAKVAAEGRLAANGGAEYGQKSAAAKEDDRTLRLPPIGAPASAGADANAAPKTSRKKGFFHADPDLTVIEYASAEEVQEVHQSAGMVQLSLENYPNQHCLAYVVILRGGNKTRVFIAFRLAESQRNLIYVPKEPVSDKAGFEKARSEAFKFLEVVGYVLEEVPLGKTAKSRGKALAAIPVLDERRKKVEGF